DPARGVDRHVADHRYYFVGRDDVIGGRDGALEPRSMTPFGQERDHRETRYCARQGDRCRALAHRDASSVAAAAGCRARTCSISLAIVEVFTTSPSYSR